MIENLIKIGDFAIPNEWISKSGYSSFLNDLDSDKTDRGALGNLFRFRLAEVPEIKLRIIKELTRDEFLLLADAIRPVKVSITYYNPYKKSNNGMTTEAFYIPKPKPNIKTINPIIYEPFDLELVAFNGVEW